MISKTYMVLGENDAPEFKIVYILRLDNSKSYTLFATHNEAWSDNFKGQPLLTLEDNGNGVMFDKSLKVLGYDELGWLKILLSIAQTINSLHFNYKIVEQKLICEL